MLKKYNEVVDLYRLGYEDVNNVAEEQAKILSLAKASAEEKVRGEFDVFIKKLEAKVSNWTREDYDQYIEIMKNDSRVDYTGILTISSAYAKTHEDGEKAVKNDACSTALIGLTADMLDRMFE